MDKDPVCGMTVTRDDAAGTSTYQGKTYYFCAPACKEQFDRSPQQYVIKRLAEAQKADS
jgi:P-type Cu+ transporter